VGARDSDSRRPSRRLVVVDIRQVISEGVEGVDTRRMIFG